MSQFGEIGCTDRRNNAYMFSLTAGKSVNLMAVSVAPFAVAADYPDIPVGFSAEISEIVSVESDTRDRRQSSTAAA